MRYLAALPCVLVLACGQESPTTLAPSNELASAAAEVDRGLIEQFARVSDAGWSVYIGFTAEELSAFCETGIFESATPWEDLAVARGPTGKLHVRSRGRDLPALVYQAAFYDVCDQTVPVFATGTANIVYTDNDWFVDGPGVESFGFTANGIVTTPDGQDYSLHARHRTIVMNGEFSEKADVQLRLHN
jgi:hypothetical protein